MRPAILTVVFHHFYILIRNTEMWRLAGSLSHRSLFLPVQLFDAVGLWAADATVETTVNVTEWKIPNDGQKHIPKRHLSSLCSYTCSFRVAPLRSLVTSKRMNKIKLPLSYKKRENNKILKRYIDVCLRLAVWWHFQCLITRRDARSTQHAVPKHYPKPM